MSRTRYEWTFADYATWYAGAVPVPIYETSSAEQVEWILGDGGAVGVFLETDKHVAVFDEVKDRLPAVTRSWVFDRGGIDELKEAGAGVSDDDLEARRASVTPDSIATIIYTSGTTGRPKGCVLTHSNFMFEVEAVVQSMPDLFLKPDASTLMFLPLAHVFGRAIQVGAVRAGVKLGHTADVKNLMADLGTFKPTFILSVPRVFEKVFNGLQQRRPPRARARSSTPQPTSPSSGPRPTTPAAPG